MTNGGPAGAIWVYLIVCFGMFTVVLSMAEMASMYVFEVSHIQTSTDSVSVSPRLVANIIGCQFLRLRHIRNLPVILLVSRSSAEISQIIVY